jgi:hypothetical protein
VKTEGIYAVTTDQKVKTKMAWQPIETAPKDGSLVLLAERVAGIPLTTPGRYHEDVRGWWEMNSHPTDYADQPINAPYAWMPLPSPPTPDRSA